LLNLGGEFKAVSIGAQSPEQTRSQGSSGPGKAGEQSEIIMFFKQCGDLLIVLVDGFGQRGNLLDQSLDHHG